MLCAVIINQNTEKGSCQKRSLLILEFQHPFPAWSRYWVINCCKGRGQSCSWLPQQFDYRNGIFDTGKTTIFSNRETNEQHCNWNSSSKLNNSSLKRHFSTPSLYPWVHWRVQMENEYKFFKRAYIIDLLLQCHFLDSLPCLPQLTIASHFLTGRYRWRAPRISSWNLSS